MNRNGKIVGGALAALALLLTAACKSGSDGDGGDGADAGKSGGTSASSSPSAGKPEPARPMAKMPAGTDAGLRHKGRLTVCQGSAGDPFMRQSTQGTEKEEGFDVDVLSLIGERIGAEPVISSYTDVYQMINGHALDNDVCDIVGGMAADTPESFPDISLSEGYFTKDQAILGGKGSHYDSLDKLAGKRVGAMTNGSGTPDALDKYNSSHSKKIKVTRLPDTNALLAQLRAGGLDAVVVGNGKAMNTVTEHPDWHLTLGGEFGTRYQARFAVRKGNTKLLKQVNAALTDAGQNGQYAKAYRDWFGGEPPAVPKAE